MKTITPAMAAHLRSEATTLTTCWRITRQDGKVFRYTELDEDVTYLGDVYKSAAGFNKSAMKSSATLAVDELEVTGFLRDDGITDEEMHNGAFDFALAEVFIINYEDETMGDIKLRYGYFGEVKTTGSGAFLVELRGLVDLLSMKIGDTYLNECRLDLGSPKCGIEISPQEHKAGARYNVGDRVIFPLESQDDPARYYPELVNPGEASWFSGRLIGEDVNMTPLTGGVVVAIPQSDSRSVYFTADQLGLTAADVASGRYKLVVTGHSFIYWENSSGWVKLANQRRYFNSGIFLDISGATSTLSIPNTLPERRWKRFQLEMDIDPSTTRFGFTVGCDATTNGVSRQMCYDDITVAVVPRDDVILGYEKFGGVEFEAKVAGQTARTSVTLDPTIGAQTVDGTVTWEASHPRYRFLGTISALSSKTTQIMAAPFPVEERWFEWGVVTFLSGKNAGRSMEVMSHNQDTGLIKLALPLPYQPQVGDQFTITAGCNKTQSVCISKFKNILNFRGHPRVPGAGQYFKVAGM